MTTTATGDNSDTSINATSNGQNVPQISTSTVEASNTTEVESSNTGNKLRGVLNRGWSFPGRQTTAAAAAAAGHAPLRSSPLASKSANESDASGEGSPNTGDGGSGTAAGTSSMSLSPATAATLNADKNIQRVASPLDQLLAKRAANAAQRPPFGLHRRAESLSSASGPPPGLNSIPVPAARPQFRPAHGRSASLSLPASGMASGASGLGLTAAGSLNSLGVGSAGLFGAPGLGGSTLTRQPHGPGTATGMPGIARPRSGHFQRGLGGGTGFQPGHLSSVSLSHAFGSSILTSSWGKEAATTSHRLGHHRVASLGAAPHSLVVPSLDDFAERDLNDGMLSNVVRTLDSLGLKEEGAAAAANGSASLGLSTRPSTHRTRSRSMLGGSAATNAAVLGDVSPSTGAPLSRPSGVSQFLKTHSRPRAISLGYFNPADLDDQDIDLDESLLSQQGSPTDPTFDYDEQANATGNQTPTRSLWIGNLPSHITSTDLMQIFSVYGSIESLRVLPDRDCAFINYHHTEDAVTAYNDMLGARLSGSLIRIGYGKADAYGSDMQGMQPTRALWIGNISPHTTSQILHQVFLPFGPIESARVLTHKNCGFVNFERLEDAIRAKSVMNGQEIAGAIVRIGFAKVPALETGVGSTATAAASAASALGGASGAALSRSKSGAEAGSHIINLNFSFPPNKPSIASTMAKSMSNDSTGANQAPKTEGFDGKPLELDETLLSFAYYTSLPALPPVNPQRRADPSRLREIRKRLDAHPTSKDVTAAFDELYPESVELSFDYIGNTVIQKLSEHGTELQKLRLLEKVGPYFASIGVHKNGTWAVQKMIDTANTPEQMHVICACIKAYTPPLLLDQFGNYVVQCCLRFGPEFNQFIFDAIHARCWEIAQGRFGARSVRTCLESKHTTLEQKKLVATAIAVHAVQMSTNSNGALLVNWLLDAADLTERYRVLAPRFLPQLAHCCTNKLASAIIFKLINQQVEPEARDSILNALFHDGTDAERTLDTILEDQNNGVPLIQKILTSTNVPEAEKPRIAERVQSALGRQSGSPSAAHRRLADEVNTILGKTNDHPSGDDDASTTK
jgi:RNA recognition motif-containing protein